MTDLKQPNTSEQNITEHLSQNRFNQISHNYRNKDYSRETQKKSASWKEKENNVCGKLHNSLTESNLGKPFPLRTTNCLIGNCSIEMSKLQQNERHNGHAFILTPRHVCELVKLPGLEFHGRQIVIEEAKASTRT